LPLLGACALEALAVVPAGQAVLAGGAGRRSVVTPAPSRPSGVATSPAVASTRTGRTSRLVGPTTYCRQDGAAVCAAVAGGRAQHQDQDSDQGQLAAVGLMQGAPFRFESFHVIRSA